MTSITRYEFRRWPDKYPAISRDNPPWWVYAGMLVICSIEAFYIAYYHYELGIIWSWII